MIIGNSIFLVVDDAESSSLGPLRDVFESVFQFLYFLEFFLKVFASGFIFGKRAYLRDYWNILDFLVVVQMFLSLVLGTFDFQLSGLRSFRVLRPLRTITSVEGIKILMQTIIFTIPLLRDTLIILVFFFFVFGIAALQVLSGDLSQRCFDPETGRIHGKDMMCGKTTKCPPDFECGQRT